MLPLVGLAVVADLIQRMNWCLLESNDEYFLLSDNPCVLVDPDFDMQNMGVGVVNRNVELTLPIGKFHCLVASWNNIPSSFKAGSRLVRVVNRRTALFGERFFVYPRQTRKVLSFVEPYSGLIPRIESQSMPAHEVNKSGYVTVMRQNIYTDPSMYAAYKALPMVFPGYLS